MPEDLAGKQQRREESGGGNAPSVLTRMDVAIHPDELPSHFVQEGPRWSAQIARRHSLSCTGTCEVESYFFRD